ncbi:hypothetical protein BDD12DRAFT_771577 [Trichophaea hybrida]|nr:hypothetical protein BDD12DRAFT_771577 [Trichophaea hybrida]
MLQCDQCDRYFVNDHALSQHLKAMHLCHCSPCGRTFSSEQAYEQHMASPQHSKSCNFCTTKFRIEDTHALNHHLKTSHSHCEPCNRTFVSDTALQAHLENSPRHDYCESCERQFRSETAYEMHMASVVHKPVCEALDCRFCGKSFAAVSALAHHLESGGCGGGATREMVDMTVMAADTQGVVVARSRFLTSPTPHSLSTALIPAHPLACPLCPPDRGPFVDSRALQQHLESPVHDSKIYHCPTLLGGEQPKKEFSTISALLQHLEAGACKGGIKTFESAVGFMTIKLREIGFGGVKLLQR